MKFNKKYLICLFAVLLALTACKKGNDNFFYTNNDFPVSVTGYNGSDKELVIKLDKYTFPLTIQPNTSFSQSNAYTFKGAESKIKLTVAEKTTGKLLVDRELKKEDKEAKVNFIYMDGKIGPMPNKAPLETDKISLVYMFQPTITNYTEPVDIVAGKYYVTPQVFEEVARAKNVKPNEYSTPITLSTFSTARQDYNGIMTSVSFLVRIYKAGTNIPYVDGTAYTWNALSSTAPKPSASTASTKLYIFSEAPAGNVMRFNTRLDL